jgi:HEPN domain-containing protein
MTEKVTTIGIATANSLRVPLENVKKNVGLGRSINQLIRLIIRPELKQQDREKFTSAIVEMFPKEGQKPKVYFDENATFQLKLKDERVTPEAVGKTFKELGWSMDDVEDIQIPDGFGDPNSGKAFIIRQDPYFFLFFDFRYNRARVKAQLERAKEFIAAARKLDPEKDHAPICEMMWAAMELIAQAVLLSLPGGIKTKDHDKLKQLDEIRKNLRVISDEFIEIFTAFNRKRPAARYPDHSTDPKWKERSTPIPADDIRQALAKIEQELETNVILNI